MKKLLCGLLCASAVFPAVAAVEAEVANIDVIAIDSGLKNTIVAIPGLDLAGGDLAISNLVKTTNLTAGDKLVAFDGTNYESWELQDGHWQKAATRWNISSTGAVEVTSTPASLVRMSAGSGIWLQRSVFAAGNKFYVYATHVDSPSTTVSAGATALVGNPTTSSATPKVATPANGDRIIVPTNAFPQYYTYIAADSKWKSISVESVIEGLPTIPAGTGFWYVSKGSSDVTVSW